MKVKVDFAELQHLQTEMGRAQSALAHGSKILGGTPVSSSHGHLELSMGHFTWESSSSFGNTMVGQSCEHAHSEAYSGVTAAMGAFSDTVDSDAERLKLAILLYRNMDDDNAEKLLQATRNGFDLFSAHLSLNGDPGKNAAQAAELQKLLGLAGDPTHGNTIIAGDFNGTFGPEDPNGQRIRDFGSQGFDPYAGQIHDGQGGTSASHRPIDQIIPRGVGTSDALRWERGQSDHDGQRVDVTLPAW